MDIIGDSFKNSMNAMSMAMIETLLLYIALPLVIAAIVLRGIFRLRGRAFNISFGIAAIACAYFFIYHGIPYYEAVYDRKLVQ
ncbi:hypothetical protein [Paenibacillus agri]|uniref:Uncharacterized protein n=1 Tax=Paenibacillus agri TaxID=2744309 RepID=A0A850EV24_9BACL|nr:hypothetical protein [Paenibacillus agri]NUU62682.1 hypothetical protein [Paenibacillus agri]